MLTNFRSFTLLFVIGWLCAILLTACAGKQNSYLKIPEGYATQTLKEFARQAHVEIIFDAQSVYGVKTNAVNGRYDPQSALRIMLRDTSLSVDCDEESGAYAVIRIEVSEVFDRILFYHTLANISCIQFSI